jgi:hypothetical protein
MTNYRFTSSEYPLPGTAWQEAKEKRKQQLAAVRNRRRLIYERMRKMHVARNRLQTSDDLV